MFLYSSLLARNQYIAIHSMRASTERITMRTIKRYLQANKKCWVTLFQVTGCYDRSQCNLPFSHQRTTYLFTTCYTPVVLTAFTAISLRNLKLKGQPQQASLFSDLPLSYGLVLRAAWPFALRSRPGKRS